MYGGSNYEYVGMCEQVNENFSLKEKKRLFKFVLNHFVSI